MTYRIELVAPFDGARWSAAAEAATVVIVDALAGTKEKRATKLLADEAAARAFVDTKARERVAKGYFASEVPLRRALWKDVKGEVAVPANAEGDDDQVLVIDGDARLPHGLELDFRAGLLRVRDDEAPIVGLLVRGDLTLAGPLVNWEDDYGPFLHVTGNLTAPAIATGGGRVRVDGDIEAREIVGVYNHGWVSAGGALRARIIATEHTVDAAGPVDALRFDGWHALVYEVRAGERDASNPFDHAGVFVAALRKGESADLRAARTLVAAGKPIALPAFSSVRDDFRRTMSKKLAAPEKVKSIALTGKNLTTLPDELFAFRALRTLDLTHNKLRTLPARIGELVELRELRLRGNGLQRLPDAIGNLVNLEVLDLEANCIVDLPASLARCVKLKSIRLVNNPYSYVRASFGAWQKVELMWALPEVLLDLPALEHLEVAQTFIRSIPDRPFESTRLAPITVKDTLLCAIDPVLHPQLTLDLASTHDRAVNYIGYWFDSDEIDTYALRDPKKATHGLAEAQAVLKLVLRILDVVRPPTERALAKFETQSKLFADRLRRGGGDAPAGSAARQFFAAMTVAVEDWERSAGASELTAGVKALFARHG